MYKAKILVVEDDPAISNLIRTTLETQDYQFHTAQNGSGALMEAVSYNPDVMILDLGLPDMDGVDIIKKGITSAHMQFEKNKKNLSCYTTPLGDMVVGIQANRIKINEEPDSLLVNVDYSLDINYEHLSDCSIRLDVQSCPQ